ncbi:MAG: DUF3501 family protein [Gammaproteobacteria bacterium]
MEKLSHDMLYSLEQYARIRPDFRIKLMEHKKLRQIALGPNARLHFEDRLTMHYQIQEILRAERIFEPEEITTEMAAYNPLIPDGSNWKATFMLEYDDIKERKVALAKMTNIEDRLWVKIDGFEHVWGIADEDLERSNDKKTASVHFLRFELTAEMVAAAKAGADIGIGIEHPAYCYQVDPIPDNVRTALLVDLD